MEIYIKAYRCIFPKMPSEVFYECRKDLELFERLCREDIMDKKRFIVDGLSIVENSPKGRKYLLEHQGGVNALCSRINGLFDKSKRLEKENSDLKLQLEAFKDKLCELGVSDVKLYGKRYYTGLEEWLDDL